MLVEIGTEATAILLEQLESQEESLSDTALEQSIPCRLIERESVKRIDM